jgi:uncharacterized DUF497 family protein
LGAILGENKSVWCDLLIYALYRGYTLFYDDFAIQFFDDENSEQEDRFLILGRSNQSKTLLISHCEKESGNLIRIISARKATAKERKLYKGEPS